MDIYDGISPAAVNKKEQNKLSIAIGLCMVFFFVELIGGLATGSLALLTDSFHLLSDVISFAISLSAIFISRWKPGPKFNFGYHRAEVIGAFISLLIIWLLTAMLLYEAYERLQNPEPIKGTVMFAIALIGVIFNVILALTLHDFHPHSHENGDNETGQHHHHHSPQRDISSDVGRNEFAQVASNSEFPYYQNEDSKRNIFEAPLSPSGQSHSHQHSNMNLKAAALHVLGDLLSSLGVLIASLFIMVEELTNIPVDEENRKPNRFLIADPICTFIFSIIVIATTVPMMRQCLIIFMEACPKNIDTNEVSKQISFLPSVKRVLYVKCWSMTMNHPLIILGVEADLSTQTTESADTAQELSFFPAPEDMPANAEARLMADEISYSISETSDVPGLGDSGSSSGFNNGSEDESVPLFRAKNPDKLDSTFAQNQQNTLHDQSVSLREFMKTSQPNSNREDIVYIRAIEKRQNLLVRMIKRVLWRKFKIRGNNAYITIQLKTSRDFS